MTKLIVKIFLFAFAIIVLSIAVKTAIYIFKYDLDKPIHTHKVSTKNKEIITTTKNKEITIEEAQSNLKNALFEVLPIDRELESTSISINKNRISLNFEKKPRVETGISAIDRITKYSNIRCKSVLYGFVESIYETKDHFHKQNTYLEYCTAEINIKNSQILTEKRTIKLINSDIKSHIMEFKTTDKTVNLCFECKKDACSYLSDWRRRFNDDAMVEGRTHFICLETITNDLVKLQKAYNEYQKMINF